VRLLTKGHGEQSPVGVKDPEDLAPVSHVHDVPVGVQTSAVQEHLVSTVPLQWVLSARKVGAHWHVLLLSK
jgi:hypothetical protein